jgi:hypothetical protein
MEADLSVGESSPLEQPDLQGRILARFAAADTEGMLIELLKSRLAGRWPAKSSW